MEVIHILIKHYKFADDIWNYIKEYLGIGYYLKLLPIVFRNLNTIQLKNIIDCTFRCVVPRDKKMYYKRNLNNVEFKTILISTFRYEFNSEWYDNKKRRDIVKRTMQTIKELGENLADIDQVQWYADHNQVYILKIWNNMNDVYNIRHGYEPEGFIPNGWWESLPH